MPSVLSRTSLAQAWRDLLYLSAAFPIGMVSFIVLITGLAVGIGTAIVMVGFPILAVTLLLSHLGANIERERAALAIGAPIARPPRRATRDSLLKQLIAFLRDRATWKELAYLLLLGPLGTLLGATALALWSAVVALAFAPAVQPSAPDGSPLHDLGFAWSLLGPLAAVVIALAAIAATRALAAGLGALAQALLAPDEREQLVARVSELETTRAGAVESSDARLRRIERDLHDGAQHRLAFIAMELGRARAKLAEQDPAGADVLLAGAHEESKRAMGELRDLVRGIHPSVLTDRGLDAAISGIAERCPLPVDVTVDMAARPPAGQETAAYYVVAESLTNVTRHSRATRAGVDVALRDGRLVVAVSDDGCGGAAGVPGSGLEGLRQRIEALDGTLSIDSPPGGPTRVRAELPCAS
jgi:signal transduction histidine kinase